MKEYYPSFYQNAVTRRLAAHPAHDRFAGPDVREAFARAGLRRRCTFELKRFGILGVATK